MASAPKSALERDPVKLDPQHYKVALENERVRIVRIDYGGHEKSPMHQHPPGVVVFVTDAKFKFTYPDGKTETIDAKAGDHLYFDKTWEHLPENLDKKKFAAVYVELKT